ncbi:MAG: hypothetical protein Q9P44_10315 [Anaerolineae bacterium]|nr:hypothetical protein [Anaerolineae bacterium]
MKTSRIRMTHKYDETPKNIFSDFDWIRRHEKELLEKYGECSIIVFKQEVIGVGKTYKDAVANAERDLPENVEEVTPVHQWLFQRHPLQRIYPEPITSDE